MKIGLLQCDHVLESYRQFGGDYDQMFAELLPGFEWVHYDVINGHFPASVHECDAYLCTGSRFSVYDQETWIVQLQALVREIREQHLWYVGVCFGHQLLAEALGGKVEKAAVGWCIGVHSFQVLQREEWMQPFQERFQLLMSCQDQVQVLPPESQVLAAAPDCPLGMFRVGERMLGMQAHPEFNAAYARALMEGRRERIGAEKVTAGLHSLQIAPDKAIMAAWMARFFRRAAAI